MSFMYILQILIHSFERLLQISKVELSIILHINTGITRTNTNTLQLNKHVVI